jgi:hypothetical protein
MGYVKIDMAICSQLCRNNSILCRANPVAFNKFSQKGNAGINKHRKKSPLLAIRFLINNN